MNERQIALRDYLVNNPSWHNYRDLAVNVYDCKTTNRQIRRDFRELNINEENEHIFISSNKGYKVADSKEVAKYIKTVQKTVLRKFRLYNTLCNKMRLNGQLTINGDEIKIISISVD